MVGACKVHGGKQVLVDARPGVAAAAPRSRVAESRTSRRSRPARVHRTHRALRATPVQADPAKARQSAPHGVTAPARPARVRGADASREPALAEGGDIGYSCLQ